MNDNIDVNPGTGVNKVSVITDEKNKVHYPVYKDVGLNAVEGVDPNYRIVNRFGSTENVSNTGFTVISHGDIYLTPLIPQSLEFVSSNIGDALNGLGAHEITIEGLNELWEVQTKVVPAHPTNGTIAVSIPGLWFRVFSSNVSASGAYATLDAVPVTSHLGAITIRNAGGGDIWAEIFFSDIAHGRTQIGAYTVPKGESAYIGQVIVHTESNKPVDVFGFKREGAQILTPPFSPMSIFTEIIGIEGIAPVNKKTWQGPFIEGTDFGYLAKKTSAGTASVSIDIEILLVKND